MRKQMRQMAVATAALVLPLAILSNPSSANDDRRDLERQRNGVSGQLDDARDSLNHSTRELNQAVTAYETAQAQLDIAEAELATVRGELSVARAYDAQMQEELEQAEADLEAAEAELIEGEERAQNASNTVKTQTLESLQTAPDGLQAFGDLLNGDGPQDLIDRSALSDNSDKIQLSRLDRLDATRVWLDVQHTIVEALRDEVQVKREEAAANLARVEELEREAAAHEAEISALVEARDAAKREAESSKAEDEATVADLEREQANLQAQIREIQRQEELERERQRQRERERNNSSGGSSSGGGGSSGGGSSSGGGNSSTTLARPVQGYITSHFGNRFHPIFRQWRLHSGTDFGAPCGRPIYAAAGGTIIQQGYMGAYGNRIVINHGRIGGNNIVTTYSHLSRYARSNGARVSRGQLIGYVGTTGASTGCHLHFEVLRNGSFVNPMGYL